MVKQRIQKAGIHFVSLALLICIFTSTAAALGDPGKIANPLPGTNSLSDFFKGIVSVLIELGTIVSVLGIMYGGFMYATAQGDEEKLGKAYKTVTWALVGTAVLLGARTIMAVIAGTVSQLGTN
ncbi:MAG: TrbC/VirB2 family protein [Patescibacteria group bacterium]